MKIYTFYEDISKQAGNKTKNSQLAMIKFWKTSWSKFGWEPVVLSVKDAESHPFWKQYQKAILIQLEENKSFLKNNMYYELCCFLRWLAVANQGGGYMSDYDVLNKGYYPSNSLPEVLTIHDGVCPCVVSGTSESLLQVCRVFSEIKIPELYQLFKLRGKEKAFNVSDQIIIAGSTAGEHEVSGPRVEFKSCNDVELFNPTFIFKKNLVHFSNKSTKGTEKLAVMKSFIKSYS